MQQQHLNYNHLHYFHVVATRGSLAAASKALGVTQPTISEQVRQLEQRLGHRLFERTSSGLVLNAEGRRAFEHTTVMFGAGEQLLAEFSSDENRSMPVLAIGATGAVSRAFATELFLPLFGVESLAPRIVTGAEEYLMRRLVQLELDLVLADTVPVLPGNHSVNMDLLHAPPLIAVADPDMAARVETFPEGLNRLPVVGYTPRARLRFDVESFLREHELETRLVGETDDVALMSSLARRGVAVAFVPESAVADDIEAGALVKLGSLEKVRTSVLGIYNQRDVPDRVRNALSILTQPSIEGLDDLTVQRLTR